MLLLLLLLLLLLSMRFICQPDNKGLSATEVWPTTVAAAPATPHKVPPVDSFPPAPLEARPMPHSPLLQAEQRSVVELPPQRSAVELQAFPLDPRSAVALPPRWSAVELQPLLVHWSAVELTPLWSAVELPPSC